MECVTAFVDAVQKGEFFDTPPQIIFLTHRRVDPVLYTQKVRHCVCIAIHLAKEPLKMKEFSGNSSYPPETSRAVGTKERSISKCPG